MGTRRMKYRKGQDFRTYLIVDQRLVILLFFLFELCIKLYLKFVKEGKVGLTQFVKNGDDKNQDSPCCHPCQKFLVLSTLEV